MNNNNNECLLSSLSSNFFVNMDFSEVNKDLFQHRDESKHCYSIKSIDANLWAFTCFQTISNAREISVNFQQNLQKNEWKCSYYESLLKRDRLEYVTGRQMSQVGKCHRSANVTGHWSVNVTSRQKSLGAYGLQIPLKNGFGRQMSLVGKSHWSAIIISANVMGRHMSRSANVSVGKC